MVRPPSFDRNGMKKGAWSQDEDNKLKAYIMRYGHWNWRLLPEFAGLKRCGKSCRLRWVNYLKPGLKRGDFSKEEQELVIKLHVELGNKWSAIAAKLPGRTDNEIKNFWHTRIEKRRKTNRPANKDFRHESDSSETTTSQSFIDANPSVSTNSLDQLDLLSDINYDQIFDLDCGELSTSGSSYINNWTAGDDDGLIHGSFWNESSISNASISEISQSSDCIYSSLQEDGLIYYDQFFDYEMNRFC